jgi:signal transduction histidine kinase
MLHLPPPTVRRRLTLLYSGLFLVSGAVLLAITYILVRRAGGPDLVVAGGSAHGYAGPRALTKALANPEVDRYVRHAAEQQYTRAVQAHADTLHQLLVRSAIALAIMTVVSIALGWLIAGRVLRPLRAMTASTRQISERNLHERLALSGPRDELKDLADTIDGLLARLQTHVAEQRRFAANASHELRTPLAVTQTLLDVARSDPSHDDGALLERLHAVNTRAIDLTEALLLLSRADLVELTVENTGETLTRQRVSTLAEPFLRGEERVRADHAGVGLGLAIVERIAQAHGGTLTLTPRTGGGLRVALRIPRRVATSMT